MGHPAAAMTKRRGQAARSISEISSCLFGPRPWHIEIRHRVKKEKTYTITLFGFETLKLKIRRLKLWKPTAHVRQRAVSTTQAVWQESPCGNDDHYYDRIALYHRLRHAL